MKPKTWTHPKFLALSASLGGFVPAAGALLWVWQLAATFSEESGRLVSSKPEEVFPPQSGVDPTALAALIRHGWVDQREDGSLWIHDWADHRPAYISDRIRKRTSRTKSVQDIPGHSRTSPDVPGNGGNGAPSTSTSPSPSRRSIDNSIEGDQLFAEVEEISPIAGRLFTALRYSGDEGRSLWKIAAALHLGLLCDSDVWGLAAVAATKTSPPAYLYKSLRDNLKDSGISLRSTLGQIVIRPDWPKEAPK